MKNTEKKGSLLSSAKQNIYRDLRSKYFDSSTGNTLDKINSFTKYTGRQNIAKLLAQHELFNQTKGILGDIVEAGVNHGSGLFGWANIAVSLEPYNYQCKIIGFDTFKGSTGVTKKDLSNLNILRKEKEYNVNNYKDILRAIEIYDNDRPLNHINKIDIVKGDVSKTIKNYVQRNKQQMIRILHLSMNLYKPTYYCLKYFLPLMSKGSIVSIDGLNHATPGCLQALKENINITKVKLKTFDYYPNFTYFEI
tara:strand:+ start:474 stop:1226 length:753 start_codon:yes stop_codon:yes gene_type:complete